jgi:Tfp pilus assembly protein PilV
MEKSMMQASFVRMRGLSLIEIPIALLVLAVVIVLATRTFSTVGNVQRDSHLGNQATAYAASKLSEFGAYPQSRLVSGRDVVVSPNGIRFERTWTVTLVAPNRTVEVEVYWASGKRTESIKLATVL